MENTRTLKNKTTLIKILYFILLAPLSISCGVNNGSVTVDSAAIPSTNQSQTEVPLVCPSNYVKVPKDSLTNKDFCVAKYEMKNLSGVATSMAQLSPWASISYTNAVAACQALGTGYDLISNSQWQTLARNIAAQGSNWSSGSVGQGYLNVGNYAVNSACSATNEYVSTSCNADATNPFKGKRTHNLSNGEIIWDLAGNDYEMVKTVSTGGGYYSSNYICPLDIPNTNPNSDQLGNFQNAFSLDGTGFNLTTSLSATNRGNLGLQLVTADNRSTNRVVIRGGANYDDGSGIFMTDIGWIGVSSGTLSDVAITFRCVYAN